jgi:VWFA-related protein
MARHGARQVAVAVLGALGAIGALGAMGAAAQNRQAAPTFRSGIDYVQIPVRVLDPRGNFVHGLTQSDFQIFEDGQLQTITAFTAVDIPFVRQDGVTPSDSPDVVGRVYAFVLDNQGMDAAIALRVRQLVRRFVTNHLAANDLAAIVLTGVGRGQPLTRDRHLLDAALERVNSDRQRPDERVHRTATVIADTARGLGSIRGRRKALVLVTASQICSLEVSECRESLNHALRVSGQSDVSIYAIDGRGLPANESTSAEHANPNSVYGVGGYTERSSGAAARRAFAEGREEFHGASSGARYLAEESGGFAVVNTNSIDEAFARLVRETSSYYLLGYNSTNTIADGKVRLNRVTTSRRGVSLVHRSSHLAPAAPSP